MADSKKYRDQAARLRTEAAEMPDPDHRRMIHQIAELYERLADHTEKRRQDRGTG
jgi:hypothetical protein